jgi:hypothetical protein
MMERQTVRFKGRFLSPILNELKTIEDSKGKFSVVYLLNNGDFRQTKTAKDSIEELEHNLKWLYPFARALFYKGPRPIIPKSPSKKRL